MLAKAKLDVFKWIAILPQIAALVGEVVEALSDKRLTQEEIRKIGSDFVAIIASVTVTGA